MESKLSRFIMVLLTLIMYVSAMVSTAPQPLNSSSVSLEVFYDGSCLVEETFNVTMELGEVQVELLAKPYEPTNGTSTLLVLDDEGGPLIYEFEDEKLLRVAVVNTTYIKVLYVTQELTEKQGEIWTLNVTSSAELMLKLPGSFVITSMDPVPETIDVEKGYIIMKYTEGSKTVTLSYTIPVTIVPINKTSGKTEQTGQGGESGTQQESGGTTQQSNQQQQEKPSGTSIYFPVSITQGNTPFILAALIILVVAAAAVIYLYKRSSQEPVLLTPEDEAIIKVLKSYGGGAYQSEIMRALGLPKTTVWRRIMRLSSLGIVEVKKVQGKNYVILKR